MRVKLFLSIAAIITFVLAAVLVVMLYPDIQKTRDVAPPFPAQFPDAQLFLDAIEGASTTPRETRATTGIIVPHHLLAREYMARAFVSATGSVDIVVVISPDHFHLGTTPISVATRDFNTAFGKLSVDKNITKKLLSTRGVAEGNFLYREHGVGAELPFIKYFFPQARLVVLTFKEDVTETDLEPVLVQLKKILPRKGVLVVESTDFSHYLPESVAATKDAETLTLLKAGDARSVLRLSQPDHLDSAAALYVQLRLQEELFNSRLVLLDHANSQKYSQALLNETTSYITALFVQ